MCETAYGQRHITVEEARQQMLMHTGQVPPLPPLVTPRPETIHAPKLLLDLPGRERDLEDARFLRDSGIALTALGSTLEMGAFLLALYAGFGQIGEAFGDAICGLSFSECNGTTTDWGAYRRGAEIMALVGAVSLAVGIPSWIVGAKRIRAAKGYAISIAPAAGTSFAGAGLTLEF